MNRLTKLQTKWIDDLCLAAHVRGWRYVTEIDGRTAASLGKLKNESGGTYQHYDYGEMFEIETYKNGSQNWEVSCQICLPAN